MKTDPILDLEKIRDVAEYLSKDSKRNELLVWVLVYTGLRIEDALMLRVRDLRGSNGKIMETISVNEEKTQKARRIKISKKLRRKLDEYVTEKPGYEFIFLSRKRSKKCYKDHDLEGPTPVTRQHAWKILSDAGRVFGIRLSPHALRKTFARRLYEISNNDITVPMRALNHTTPTQTETYIGLTETSINSYVEGLDF